MSRQGSLGAQALARPVVVGRGGRIAHGMAQAQHARPRWDDPMGPGLRQTRRVLGDHGLGQGVEGRPPAGDAGGCV